MHDYALKVSYIAIDFRKNIVFHIPFPRREVTKTTDTFQNLEL